MGLIPSERRRCARFRLLGALLMLALAPRSLRAQDVTLTFAADSAAYAPSAAWNQQLWDADGRRILRVMEAASGLRFRPLDIRVIMYLGVSYTGSDSLPMHLNVRYPFGMTLVHELGHRLNGQIRNRPPEVDEHRLLYLWLYDAWVALYGKRFADAAVQAEKGWAAQGLTFIVAAWDWALAMTEEQRASLLRELRER